MVMQGCILGVDDEMAYIAGEIRGAHVGRLMLGARSPSNPEKAVSPDLVTKLSRCASQVTGRARQIRVSGMCHRQ